MNRVITALVISFGLGSFGVAHAASTSPLTRAQQQQARAEIKAKIPNVRSVKFGYGPTPPDYIGNGIEMATVRTKTSTMQLPVTPGVGGKVNVDFNIGTK